ncbi:protein of unassigned function [Methylobacterium oryzae CBMB20]|uniref:Protein of unassigned function n=2 Tax=Methylobacterium oryzae TaxID=334852 RepID=A0A089Q9V1_9HYPH|nr:protein of unassigned function [Methylobacterium oryzae CBMB20]
MATAMMTRLLCALLLPGMVVTSGLAIAGGRRDAASSPEAAFRELVSYDRPNGERELFGSWRSPTMARLVSADLSRTWTRAGSTQGNFFDGSVLSGRQSVSGASRFDAVRTIRNDGRRSVVETLVTVHIDGRSEQQRQRFTFVFEDDRWKLDEIDYAVGTKPSRSLHAHLLAWMNAFMMDHLRSRAPAKNGVGDDVQVIADRAVDRAKAVYGEWDMNGLHAEVQRCGKAAQATRARAEISSCLGFTWAALRIDTLGSSAFGMPMQLKARDLIEPLENAYMHLGGRYQDAYDLSQTVTRQAIR